MMKNNNLKLLHAAKFIIVAFCCKQNWVKSVIYEKDLKAKLTLSLVLVKILGASNKVYCVITIPISI